MEYSGDARWDAIAEVKNAVKIPVIGNGDVKNLMDAERMIDQTGCDAVMIGRAAIGNPWIFSGSQRSEQPTHEIARVIELHLNAMALHYGEKIAVLLFRKHLKRYLEGYLTTSEIRREIFSHEKTQPLLQQIRSILIP
jgi:tRNA-dihydrouridine synthase